MPRLKQNAMRTSLAALALAGALGSPAAAAEMEWSFETIGRGIKPALAIDAGDTPHVAFLTEEMRGGVFYATNKSGAWTTSTVAEGYFYGPVDIDVTSAGVAHIVYHDHEDRRFRRELGAGVVAIGGDGGWQLVRIEDEGHDQWDADIAVEDNGTWHFAGIDPVQFGSPDGLEYATNAFGAPRVEQVGSGPLPYEFGVSIELAAGGVVGISYFDAEAGDLRLAERAPGENGAWSIATVQSAGDVGRYSSLAYGADGTPHISYFAATGGGGTVRYATRGNDGAWAFEDIGTLGDVVPGMTGARKITSLALDAEGNPHVMFTDRRSVVYASRKDGAWTATKVFDNAGAALGQLVEFALDSQGRPHAAFFEVTSTSGPLMGDIIYATAGGGES